MPLTFDDVRRKHSGRSAVVMGSGPSLHGVDDRIKRHVTIAVNDAVEKIRDPDYFFSTDATMRDSTSWADYIRPGSFPVVLYKASGFTEINILETRILWYQRRGRWDERRMSSNDTNLLIGINGAHCAVHFAVILGCSPIYLIGCDCMLKNGAGHFWELEGKPSSHLIPYDQRRAWLKKDDDGRPLDGHLCAAVAEWKSIHDANLDILIYDASQGRLATIFPGVSLGTLL